MKTNVQGEINNDDNKKNNVIYMGKKMFNPDGSSYRKAELFMNEDLSFLSEKNKEPNSIPVDLEIKEKVTLYQATGGQQKIQCWLLEDSANKRINAIHISRRTSKGVYGSQEVTLSNRAISYLYEFLNSLIMIDTDQPTKIPLENKITEETKFKQIISEKEFIDLIKTNIRSTDDFYKLLYIQKMNLAIEKLENIIDGGYKNEVEIQHFLKENFWMFGNNYTYIIENGKINSQNIMDMVPQNFESYIDIIEVKLPKEKLFNYDNSHKNYYPTSHLTKAISQTQNYIFELEKKTSDIKYENQNNCKIIKPKGIILFGSNEPLNNEETKYLRILNSSYHNLTIITYQQLLEKAKNTLNINRKK